MLPDGLDAKIKQEAEVSIGTDIAPDDLEQVLNMCDEVCMIPCLNISILGGQQSVRNFLKTHERLFHYVQCSSI